MAQNKRRRLGGARYNKPHELHDKLKALGGNYNEFYDDILRHAVIRWDFDAHEVWVEGRFRGSKNQMIAWTGLSDSSFHIKWRELVGAGLIRVEEDGVWVATMVIRKEDVGVSEAEMRRMQERQVEVLEELQEMKGSYQQITAMFEELRAEKTGELRILKTGELPILPILNSGEEAYYSGIPEKKASSPESRILLKVLNKETSLTRNNIISGFYSGIGQTRISKVKRERGLKVFRKLRKDGFSLEDIAFAVDWTLENAKEEPYDFSIIEHTIGQAIAARDKQESKRREMEKREKAKAEEESEREAEEREREKIEEYKANLSPENRAALRERAEAEISAAGIYKPGFISEPLISAKENEFVRKELEE